MSEHHTAIKTVISGSYRKHLNELMNLKKFLQSQSIQVLSPVGNASINPGQEFVLLDEDPIADHRLLQDSVFAKIRTSTFLVLANVDGYIGKAALLEMGYSIAQNITILTLEEVTDPNLAPYCRLLKDVFPKIQDFKYKQASI